jgi:nicotinate-nucleotide adenylyltransferase
MRYRVTQLDISSTRLRDLVAAGRSPRYLVPDAVWAFIREGGLYAGRAGEHR